MIENVVDDKIKIQNEENKKMKQRKTNKESNKSEFQNNDLNDELIYQQDNYNAYEYYTKYNQKVELYHNTKHTEKLVDFIFDVIDTQFAMKFYNLEKNVKLGFKNLIVYVQDTLKIQDDKIKISIQSQTNTENKKVHNYILEKIKKQKHKNNEYFMKIDNWSIDLKIKQNKLAECYKNLIEILQKKKRDKNISISIVQSQRDDMV